MCHSDIAWGDPILIWGSEIVTGIMGNCAAQYAPIFPAYRDGGHFRLRTEYKSYVELIDSLAFPLNARHSNFLQFLVERFWEVRSLLLFVELLTLSFPFFSF